MKVFELAEEFNTTSEVILNTLRSLKLKAKGEDQQLNVAVVSVLRSELKRKAKEGSLVQSKDENITTTQKESSQKEKKDLKKRKDRTKKRIEEQGIEIKVKEKVEKKTKIEELNRKNKKKDKKVPVKDLSRIRKKIGKEPVITLKPLGRRKKRPIKDEKKKKEEPLIKDKITEDSTGNITFSPSESEKKEDILSDPIPVQDKKTFTDLEIDFPITVKELSSKMQQKSSLVLKQLMKIGVFAHINQSLNEEIARKVAEAFGFNITRCKTQEEQLIEIHKQEEDNPELLEPRAPVITFMGHVDHGKTTLLDRIRKTNVVDKEHGGITQHIGAYSVLLPNGRITFLDTPGHEAFTAMRARGANITDIIVLVVAADEGVMPQTEEAIDHARAAGVPIVVALNKIDKRNADIDRVKKQLAEHDLTPEDWGGKTVVVGVSAVTGEGVDHLLEMILLEAELLELKANPHKKASGIIVEAHLSRGKGVVCTVIVQSGTLREGDIIVVGPIYGKVRAMFDDHERTVKEAGPSMPVEILGLPEVPEAGDIFYVVDDEKRAKEISLKRQEELKNKKLLSSQRITLEDLYSQMQKGEVKELNVILKADVRGSLEALKDSLEKIPSEKVKIRFIHLGVGDVNTSDVILAVASNAIIIAFQVGIEPRAKVELEKTAVDVRKYSVIYNAVDDIKKALEGMLEAKVRKHFLARIEVREVFKLTKHGIVAGCYVQKGKVNRKAKVDIIRNGDVIFSSTIQSLKRFKDDVREVNEGMECGIIVEGFSGYQKGDIIEVYEIETIAQKL